MFNIRAVSLDHYISKPIDELYEKEELSLIKEWQEPVLRIFGATPDGIKSCVHIHGVYPYIYVPYNGGENAERDALLLGAAIDEALKASFKPKAIRFVHKVTLISGIPLYGYHSRHRQFFKIYFYNPFHIRKVSELLLSGAILEQKFQPHEAHIPYALQFMMDYNIYGMSFVTFSKVKYRRNPDNPDSVKGVREEDILSEKVKKMTWSHLEVDAWASDILSRFSQKSVGTNPGLEAIWEDEKYRRRAQNRNSQITLQQSQSRPEVKPHSTEIMYKDRLAQKLKEVPPEGPGTSVSSEEPTISYPAEVSENENLLEASAMEESVECPRAAESVERPRAAESVGDLRGLIDDKLLTQISEDESEGEIEAGSVLGRGKASEEEAEPEDEEDMTQPLDSPLGEEVICGAEGYRRKPGCSGGTGEDNFWRNMADKIFQLDGAQESSSESEFEAVPSEFAPIQDASDGSPELPSAWSTNIMSILSECSDCPTPSAPCSTPRTFWFDYTPDYLTQNQDAWSSSKNVAVLSDSAGKNQNHCLDAGQFPGGPKEGVPGEPYGDLFSPSGGEYFPLPSLGVSETAVSPSAILTSASEITASDINLDSILGNFHSPSKEKKKVPSSMEGKLTESKIIISGKAENDQHKVLQVLKSFAGRKVPLEDNSGHLTLKQYIKDCKEIVSVDFKNLCNREMIIIEYKSQNKRSLGSKYLIKPLDKFLESWNSAERKVSDRREEGGVKLVKEFDVESENNLRSNYVINVLEKRFSDSSTVQSMSNKLTVKSMEILPEGGNNKDRCYNVNENIISRGEIKMKLIKSRGGNVKKNLVDGTLKRRRSEKCRNLDLESVVEARDEKSVKKEKRKHENSRGNTQNDTKIAKSKQWKIFPEPDTKLINEINSSFEEYFKSIVKRKNFYRKRKKNGIEKMNEGEEMEKEESKESEETSEDEEAKFSPSEKRKAKGFGRKLCSPSEADPMQFVTRFLSTFSQMSDLPLLSITIRLGNSRTSVPIKVNLRPPSVSSGKETKYRGRKHGRSTKEGGIESVDGAAGDSSSEESEDDDSRRRSQGQTRGRRGGHYKPLDVIVCDSPAEKGVGRKRKASVCRGVETQETAPDARRPRKSSPVQPPRGGENPKSWPPLGGDKKKISNRSSVKAGTNSSNLSKSSSCEKVEDFKTRGSQELDFIAGSDEEEKLKRAKSEQGILKREKKNWKVIPRSIPQADTEAFSTSDEDEMQISPKEIIRKDLSSLELEPTEKTREEQNEEKGVLESGEEPKAVDDAEPKVLPSPVAPCTPNTLPAFLPLASRCSQDSETAKPESPQPETSFGLGLVRSDGLAKQFVSHRPFSSLALSGSSLFASENNSMEPEPLSSPTPEALVLSQKESLLNIPNRSSSSFERVEFCSGKRFLGSMNSDDADAGCVSSAEGKDDSLDWVRGSKVIRPKIKPLDRKLVVKSMQRYDIVESEEKAPFFGDPRDLRKAVVTGFKVLKIENRSVAGLKPFKSSLDVSGTEERRNASSRGEKVFRWWLVGNEEITITPLMKPPSRGTVTKSSCAEHEEESRRKASGRLKVMKPLSPGQEMESEEEMELSVTTSILSMEDRSLIPKGAEDAGNSSPAMDERNVTKQGLKKGPLIKIKGVKRSSPLENSGGSGETGHSKGGFPPRLTSGKSDSSGEGKRISKEDNSFQIRGVTLNDPFGFSHSIENMGNVNLSATYQYMSMLVMEVHVQTRKDLRPDPEYDQIRALFYTMTFDSPTGSRATGAVVVGEGLLSETAAPEQTVDYVSTERALLEKFVALVREWDPDILTGYEIEMQSWGYLVQRGFILEMNLLQLLGRVQTEDFARKKFSDLAEAEDDTNDVPRSVKHMKISGRIVLDAWRVLRHEIALTSYTFENVMYHLSHERHPLLSYEMLSYYWEHPSRKFRHLVVEHFATRVLGLIKILDQLDFINRTSELSRLFGIQFYEVLSRGSQFRVESMMLRLAKPLNYVPASPSVSQRASMRAPASVPLILEPESFFYTDPVIVLDFQSLYPSIIIAYNYCFSTCLGRVEKLGGREPFEFGCTQLQISPEELKSLENDLTVSPAGIAFVKSNIRKGILPTMLEKILDTRLMVKKAMKENKDDKVLQKVLFARQLGLKLIANVTYGYTAANFSGRMPCIEVGDSVVSKGRETLHRAIQLVKNTREWGARVVYGDTDSIFVLTPGRSREEAFRIGAEIAEAVTLDNPKPVKLKLEKVYQPSILQTKKRYVGYMFESPDQKKPVFEAKGIETVRRDGCPATGKILEKALRILFETRDVSLVKKYTLRQFSKLFQGRVNVQDLIFAKEYRGRKGYRAGACVPALQLARQWTQSDKRREPRVKERVPYVVVNGPPGVPLIRLVRSPADLISEPTLRINAAYYITKVIIPPMQRCFSLLGADVASWYAEMPKKHHKMYKRSSAEVQKRSTISQYFAALECVVCFEETTSPVCQKCEKEPQTLAVVLSERIRRWERCRDGLAEICRSCSGGSSGLDCVSLDCPVFFRRKQAEEDEEQRRALQEIVTEYL